MTKQIEDQPTPPEIPAHIAAYTLACANYANAVTRHFQMTGANINALGLKIEHDSLLMLVDSLVVVLLPEGDPRRVELFNTVAAHLNERTAEFGSASGLVISPDPKRGRNGGN